MKRLLCIVGSMNPGGAETFLMKIYRTLDRAKYQMDFCVSIDAPGAYDDEIKSLGGRIIHTTPKSKGALKAFLSIRNIVKTNQYKYVLRVSQHSLSALELVAAKMGGARRVAYRSSNTQTGGGRINRILHKICLPLSMFIPDAKFAPSTEAADFMFGKNCIEKGRAKIVNNGLSIENYKYDENARKALRSELDLNGKIVVGHVGRLSRQKNHKFLLEVFYNIYSENRNAVLILVGQGELKEQIVKQCKELGIYDNVKFLGVRSDIGKLLSAFDLFIFPSLFEGMPNTILEAQTSGLPCIISDTITREAMVTKRVVMCSLSESAAEWATKAMDLYNRNKDDRNKFSIEMKQSGYDINDCVRQFQELIFQ